jgi:aldehyde dehydrogenase (NAD+)
MAEHQESIVDADGVDSYWRNFVDGRWVDAREGRRRTVLDPATAGPLAEVALGSARDIDDAVAAARRCVESRALVSVRPVERLRWVTGIGRELAARRDRAAHVLSRDSGKALSEAYTEVDGAIRYFEYYGALADKLEGAYIPLGDGYVDYTVLVPHGVSAHIIPWNYPAEMVGRGVAPALAAGNAVVVKAPELDPLGCHVIAEAVEAAGLPDGAFNLITGDGADAGAALVRHPGVDQIVFTGSVETGRSILHAAADRIVPTLMELGGKSAAVVFDDADLDALVDSTRWGIFSNAGQVCSAMSRMIVTPAVHDEIVDRVSTLGKGLRVGAGIDDAELTPVVSPRQLERVMGFTDRARSPRVVHGAHGARRCRSGCGGRARRGLRPRPVGPTRRLRRRGDRDRQRHRLRVGGRRVHPGPGPRVVDSRPAGRRAGVRQRVVRGRCRDALRGRQAIGVRPREGPGGAAQLRADQERRHPRRRPAGALSRAAR